MEIDGGDGAARQDLSTEARPIFREGIGLTFSRWAALQMAIDHEWGGRNTRLRAEQLVDEVFDWFTQSKEFYADDLENLLFDFMLKINTEVEDGSVEEKLYDDEDDSSDDEGDEMQGVGHQSSMMEKEESAPNSSPADMSVDKPIAEKTAEAEAEDKDGWTTVSSSRKKKGSRQQK
uniref:Pre-rRNA-processing protein TSR2 n=1 Tax=Kalanchoe fedtschenkoi TaxID=63787 RepID=A0A7N0V9P6_KALFE